MHCVPDKVSTLVRVVLITHSFEMFGYIAPTKLCHLVFGFQTECSEFMHMQQGQLANFTPNLTSYVKHERYQISNENA